ncbi:modular serine protease-like isoform X2 [Cydia pomonella]|uniref:modular serine protease-like isoform X2 n=1 Tax=Cydia pomonella TaxID=82600 RepID=UPI002ADD60BB|nr:modular serine protease-like isoform X2 [Cydia pomonella]
MTVISTLIAVLTLATEQPKQEKEDWRDSSHLSNKFEIEITSYSSPNESGRYLSNAKTVTLIGDLLVQWNVGIYSKAFEPYMQICGGTLVTTKAVISAAHCFWRDGGALPASQFAVVAGKLYRPWNDSHDFNAQHAEISAIHIPARFRGAATSFQADIAAVLLAKEFTITSRVHPLCVHFDEDLEADILQSDKKGLIVGWGLTSEDGPPSQTLQYLYMPNVPIEECIADAEPGFLKYITSDKICAGVTTGQSLCRGDSGGGLVFFESDFIFFDTDLVFVDSEHPQPLLYGIASTAPRSEHSCNTHARATLTRVLAHRAFLRAHIPDIENKCVRGLSSRILK